jgi:hypothetical protein
MKNQVVSRLGFAALSLSIGACSAEEGAPTPSGDVVAGSAGQNSAGTSPGPAAGASSGGVAAGGSSPVTAGGPPSGGGGAVSGGGGAVSGVAGTGLGGGGSGGAGSVGGATTAGAGGSGGASGGTANAGGSPPTGDATAPVFPSENTGAACQAAAGELKKNAKLPDPFALNTGSRIASKAAWECRRNEIKKDVEKYEIGPKPEAPMVQATYSAGKLSVQVTTSAGSITLSSTVATAAGKCVAIGMNGNSSLVTGCVQVPFMHDQVVKYGSDSTRYQSDLFYKVYPELWGKVANYAAWSWGISRIIDGIFQVKDQLGVDTTKIAVHGCSYAGKMALFAGAFDERVALTVAQESGGGGITSWRTSQDFATRTGTNVEKIDNTNFSWFLPSMKSLDPYSLPHDHHELIAMIAPRAVVALGNQDFEWLGDESGWRSVNAAKEVWKALGVPDRIGFDFTSNHGHCAAPASQVATVKAFVDKFLKGQTANTEIAIKPQEGNFDLDHTKVIDWTTPTLP